MTTNNIVTNADGSVTVSLPPKIESYGFEPAGFLVWLSVIALFGFIVFKVMRKRN
jgi:hypothetical protein